VRTNLRTAFIEGVVVSIVFSAGSFGQERERIPMAEHGAASMQYQLAEYDKLVPQADVTAAPAGVDPVVWEAFLPRDNAMSAARVALGKALYFDKRLSKDGTVSCATCHDVTRAFTDQRRSPRESMGSSVTGTRPPP
jgi:cytochrome c peroxidase